MLDLIQHLIEYAVWRFKILKLIEVKWISNCEQYRFTHQVNMIDIQFD